MINEPSPEPNIPLLRKAVEWAEVEAQLGPDVRLWEQKDYVTDKPCGTAYCIAGWAVANHAPGVVLQSGSAVRDGEYLLWHEEGRALLGLTADEAEDLFDENNSIKQVRTAAEQIAARAGERL